MYEAAGRAVAKMQGVSADVDPRSRKDTTFIIQGITGREAVNLTREGLDYGSKIVGGVTPGRAGRDVYGVPVYDCVRDITSKHARRRLDRHGAAALHARRRVRGASRPASS